MGIPDYTMNYPSSPVLENLFKRKAEVQLKFIIVGGSIGGLACAYNLKHAGHEVHVLERSKGFADSIGCLRVPPNMTRLLLHWGLKEQVLKNGFKCPEIEFIDGKTGEYASSLVFHEEVMKELQADTYNMHFADLHKMILDITLASGVRVDFGAEVVDVDISEPSVLLGNGERLYGNIIIGAEGTESIVRERIVGYQEELKVGPYTGYTFTIPVKEMLKDPDLSLLLKDGKWKLWMGSRRCVLTHLVRPSEYGVQIISPNPDAALGWHEVVQLPLKDTFSDFEPRCRKLLALGKEAVETQHVLQEQLEDWFDDDGHAVLVGDSIHYMNPGTSHGAASAMEDAAVLGSLFSRLRENTQEEIIRLLSAYQEIRQARCAELRQSEYEKIHFAVLEEGDPIRDARDAGFALSRQQQSLDWTNVDDEVLQQAWDEFKSSYAYDAYDAADDWWVDWGLLRERLRAASYASDTRCFVENGLNLAFAQAVVVASVTE